MNKNIVLAKQLLSLAKVLLAESDMKLKDMVDPLKNGIKTALPNCFVSVVHNTGIADSITIRFSKEPKSEWPGDIFQNASYLILHIADASGSQREGEGGKYSVTSSSGSRNLPNFRKKTATADKLVKYIVDWFAALA